MMNAESPAQPKLRPCPICKKPSVAEHKPFCSPRCADVDLNRWLSGSYAIPGKTVDDDEEERVARPERE
jgi:uncharacterized protein